MKMSITECILEIEKEIRRLRTTKPGLNLTTELRDHVYPLMAISLEAIDEELQDMADAINDSGSDDDDDLEGLSLQEAVEIASVLNLGLAILEKAGPAIESLKDEDLTKMVEAYKLAAPTVIANVTPDIDDDDETSGDTSESEEVEKLDSTRETE